MKLAPDANEVRVHPYPPAPFYHLGRDGCHLFSGTEEECWRYIRAEWDLGYRGYYMEPA